MNAPSPWVIVGCGYTGERLARRLLSAGARVVATRRTEAGARAVAAAVGGGIEARALDLARPDGLERLCPEGAVVVHAAPPGSSVDGEERLVAAAAGRARRLVYLSSTGVYPPGRGDWVDEEAPVGPESEHGRRRLAAERALLGAAAAAGLEAVSLRVAGIYGPGRGVHERLRRGGYRVLGAGDSFVSRVHVDDLVSAILAAAAAAPLLRRVYHVADDEPTTARELADQVAALLDLPPPPSIDPAEASPIARALLLANRRIANRRLKEELGVALAYPTWREGIRAALAAP